MFLAALGRYRIIEFAGHAQVDTRAPLFSRLLLAPEGSDKGVLFARDLYGRHFSGTEVVILAACATAGGALADSEGLASLSRPFLAGGVPAVIGSLWAVNDQATAELSIELHRHLAAGADPATALRAAQLKLLSSYGEQSTIGTWAAFELFGAGRPAADDRAHTRSLQTATSHRKEGAKK